MHTKISPEAPEHLIASQTGLNWLDLIKSRYCSKNITSQLIVGVPHNFNLPSGVHSVQTLRSTRISKTKCVKCIAAAKSMPIVVNEILMDRRHPLTSHVEQ